MYGETHNVENLETVLAACYRIARERARQLKKETAPAETLQGDTANAASSSSANDVDASRTPKQTQSTPK